MCATCTGSTNAFPSRSGDATASSLCTRVRRLLARQRDAKSPLPTRVVAGRLHPTLSYPPLSHCPRHPTPPSTGFISDCRFLSEETLLTASGDMTCAAWDLERGSVRDYFMGHTGAVTSISVSPEKGEVCVAADRLNQCHCPPLFLSLTPFYSLDQDLFVGLQRWDSKAVGLSHAPKGCRNLRRQRK